MTPTVSDVAGHGPAAVAELAAEALRKINHLTLASPTSGTPGWEGVGDLYGVLSEVAVAVERVPQVLDQMSRHLDRSADKHGVDGGTNDTAIVVVSAAVLALCDAQGHLRHACARINDAQSAVAHLCEPSAEGRG